MPALSGCTGLEGSEAGLLRGRCDLSCLLKSITLICRVVFAMCEGCGFIADG